MTRRLAALVLCIAIATHASSAQPQSIGTARDILRELIAINTAEPDGNTTRAAELVGARLKAAGFTDGDVQILGPDDRHGSLVARLRGSGKGRPVLFLAHLDVVPAAREDWSVDPFVLTEKDGYYYGRGTTDDKQFASIWTAAFISAKRTGFMPDRDLILALTAGEETGVGDQNGVIFLLARHRALVDAEYVINGDAGGGSIQNGRNVAFGVQAAEKRYMDVALEVTNPGGHSSLPVKDNAIYRLARALGRVDELSFPIRLNDVTRAYFEKRAAIDDGTVGDAMRALAAGTRRCSRNRASHRGSDQQQHDANDVRGDHRGGRPCPQRPAATREGQYQLPPAAGRCAGGGRGRAEAGDRRPGGFGHAGRQPQARATDTGASSGRNGRYRGRRRGRVAGCPAGPADGTGRHRWRVFPGGRHSCLRRESFRTGRRRARPRTRRADWRP